MSVLEEKINDKSIENKIKINRNIKEESKLKLLNILKKNSFEQVIVGFSGGKDSSATLQLLIDTIVENKINIKVKVLSSNTLIENPLIENQLIEIQQQIENIAKNNKIDMKHLILTPKETDTFWVNTIGKGYATPLSSMGRWCTRALKVDPMEKFYKGIDKKTLVLSGVRESESTLRKKNIKSYFKENLQKDSDYVYKYAPIRYFELKDVWDYIIDPFRNDKYYINNNTLWEIYRDGTSDDVCPSSLDMKLSKEKVSSCGQSRYGCYMCPLVKKDKALEANIKNGRTELEGLLEIREWYMQRCYDPINRSRFNRKRNVKLKEIKIDDKLNFEYTMLYTKYKGNLEEKMDYKNRVINIVDYNEEYKDIIDDFEKNYRFEKDEILIFRKKEEDLIKYYRPTTAMLSFKFRKELYEKIIDIEKKYKINILKDFERGILEKI